MEPTKDYEKQVFIEHHGGFKDGERLDSRSADHNEGVLFSHLYLGSEGGTAIGYRYWSVSNAATEELFKSKIVMGPDGPRREPPVVVNRHLYELTERTEDADSVTLRFDFVETIK